MNESKPLLNKSGENLGLKYISCMCSAGTLCFLSLSLICYLAFISNEKWYSDAADINCIINRHEIAQKTCFSGENSYDCYNGYIGYNYYIKKDKYNNFELIFNRKGNKQEAKIILAQYPIGSNQTCWYKVSNPKDITLIEKSNYGNYSSSIVFLIIGIITGTFSIVLYIYGKYF
jgi:hypothetical protein